jgi:hypothetical protein
MNAVVIYERMDLALKAYAALERAAHQAEGFHWHIRPWRVDLILSPDTGNVPLKDAEDAHLLVFALSSAGGLPPRLAEWLETWAVCRTEVDAALAIFDGAYRRALGTPMAGELTQFANRHGLCLLAGDAEPAGEHSPEPADHHSLGVAEDHSLGSANNHHDAPGSPNGDSDFRFFARDLQERAVAQTSTISYSMDYAGHERYRAWGIND